MFGKKKIKEQEIDTKGVDIKTIPDIFYGGQNPIIYKSQNQEPAERQVEEKATPKPALAPVKKPAPPVAQLTKKPIPPTGMPATKHPRKLFIILGVVGFVAIVAGISWYYSKDLFLAKQSNEPVKPIDKVADNNSGNENITNPPVTTSTTSTLNNQNNVATSTTSLDDAFLDFPVLSSLDTSDIDSDKLTDVEEEIFSTDSGTWDTDKDGYYDGQEILNLYNPKGFAPVKLIDSGLISEYLNPKWGYRLYYPRDWVVGSVDANSRQVLISSASGDYMEIRVFDEIKQTNFNSWFAENAKKQKITDLQSDINRFKVEFKRRSDNLVTYFEDRSRIFVLIYHPKDIGPIFFRHVIEMASQSFRPGATNVEIPIQSILPGVTVPTSTVISSSTEENIVITNSVSSTATSTVSSPN